MMEYQYYLDGHFYTVLATTPWDADRLLDKLVGSGAHQSAITTSVKAVA